MPQVLAEVRKRILDRLEEGRTELDPNRLEQELALLAQRLDELGRHPVDLHFDQFFHRWRKSVTVAEDFEHASVGRAEKLAIVRFRKLESESIRQKPDRRFEVDRFRIDQNAIHVENDRRGG